MGVVSLSLPADGSTGTVSQYNTPLTTLQTEFNGNIDNNNIKSGAAIATAKLADDAGITTGKIADGAITPSKMLGIDLLGKGAAVIGSAPTAGTGQFYIQSGTTVATFTANSSTLSFPSPFPNGVLSIIVSNGDSSNGSPTFSVFNSSVTASAAAITSSTASGTQRFNWIAIGF